MTMTRTATLHMRLTVAELATMKAAADVAGHSSLSAWVRCIAYEASACGASGRELAGALVAVRADLGRIGNNLNQVAKHLNQSGDSRVSLDVLDQLNATTARLSEMLNSTRPTVPLR